MTLTEFFGAIAQLSGLVFLVPLWAEVILQCAARWGWAQRNVSAAIVVAAQNFPEGNTMSFILVSSILFLLILLPTAKRLGRRNEAAA